MGVKCKVFQYHLFTDKVAIDQFVIADIDRNNVCIFSNTWSQQQALLLVTVLLGCVTVTYRTGDRKIAVRLSPSALAGNNLGQVVHTRASVHQAV